MGQALRLGWVRGPSTAARTDFGAEPCGWDRFGKLPFGKLRSWEVATLENTLGNLSLGEMTLKKYLTFINIFLR